MKRWSARNVTEAIGIVGVIASLIFVGGELRQNAIATRAATNADVSVAFVELNLMIASSPELARAFAVGAMETHDNTDLVRRRALLSWAWQNERFIYNQEFQNFVDDILGSMP